MKKINFKKIIAIIGIVFLLTVCLIFLFGNNNTLSHGELKYKKIYVSRGETLWEIAKIEAINNDYYANKDIRYIVKDIKKVNNLKNSSIYIGQELLVPNI